MLSHDDKEAIRIHMERGKDDLEYFSEHLLGIKFNKGQAKTWSKVRGRYVPIRFYLCGNQSGKSVYIACKHLWKAFYKKVGPGIKIAEEAWEHMTYTTIGTAPLGELTKIMYDLVLTIARGGFIISTPGKEFKLNQSRIKWFVDFPGNRNPRKAPKASPYEIDYANGAASKFYTLGGSHGDNIQGVSHHYYSYDEVGRSASLDSEMRDIVPRLGKFKAELDCITTPDMDNHDASEYILQQLEESNTKTRRYQIEFLSWSTNDNEYFDDDSRKIMTTGRSEEEVAQIMRGEIMRANPRYYPRVSVDAMFDPKLKYIDFVNRFPDARRKYHAGLDTAGLGKDGWAFYVMDCTDKQWNIVYKYVKYGGTPSENRAHTRSVVQQFYQHVGYMNFTWRIDYTSEGGTIVYDDLRDLEPIPTRFGFEARTGKNMKHDLTDTLKRSVIDNCIRSPEDDELYKQLRFYKGPSNDKKQQTDCVMALALAAYDPFNEKLEDIDTGSQSIMVLSMR